MLQNTYAGLSVSYAKPNFTLKCNANGLSVTVQNANPDENHGA